MPQPQPRTLKDTILSMSDEEVVRFAKSRASECADSSRLEGLVLDEEKLEAEYLATYQEIRGEHAEA